MASLKPFVGPVYWNDRFVVHRVHSLVVRSERAKYEAEHGPVEGVPKAKIPKSLRRQVDFAVRRADEAATAR